MKSVILPGFLPNNPPVGPGFDDAQYEEFKKRILSKTGIKLSDYKPDQMRRRVSMMAIRAGYDSYSAYVSAMDKDPTLLATFLDKMTINVSELMRNPQRFEDLMKTVVPRLLKERNGTALTIWSAGCSYGAEAYTLAMLFNEANPGLRHKIHGTDIDTEILRKARDPKFTAADMANISEQRRKNSFVSLPNDQWTPTPQLKSYVEFRRHDLLVDPYPRNEYDLILCRNVVIYFTDTAKERIYRGFFDALKPGGVLFVGGTERLADHRAIGFDLLIPFFYRKPDR